MLRLLLQALVHARDLTPTQAPIILWAFAVLRYNPVVAVLSALDRQVEKLASQITAQVSPAVHIISQDCKLPSFHLHRSAPAH